MLIEQWKDIEGYEGVYSVSSFGRVKSEKRIVSHWRGGTRILKERILKSSITNGGYLGVLLCKPEKQISKKVHKLVAIAFLNHKPNGHKKIVDHIDGNKSNNNIDNLQIISNRENCSKDQYKHNRSSKYVGVAWYKKGNKWRVQIQINGKQTHLGYFNTELKASEAYKNKLNSMNY